MSTIVFNPKEWSCDALKISRKQLKDKPNLHKTLASIVYLVNKPENDVSCAEVTNDISQKVNAARPLIDKTVTTKLITIVEELKKNPDLDIEKYSNAEKDIDLTLDYQLDGLSGHAKKLLALYKKACPQHKAPAETKPKHGGKKDQQQQQQQQQEVTPHHQNSRALTIACASIDESPEVKSFARAEMPQNKKYYTTQRIYNLLNKSGVCKFIKSSLVGIRTGRYSVGSLSGQLPYALYKEENKDSGVATEWKDVVELVHPTLSTSGTSKYSCAQITQQIRGKKAELLDDQNAVVAKLIAHDKGELFFKKLFDNNNRNSPMSKMANFFTINALHQEVKDPANDTITLQQQTDKWCDVEKNVTALYEDSNAAEAASSPDFVKTIASALKEFGDDDLAKAMVKRVIPFLVPYLERFVWCALNKVMANIVNDPDHHGLGDGAPVAMLCQTNKSRDEQFITAFIDQQLKRRNKEYRLSGAAKKLLKDDEKTTKAYNWWKNKCLGKRHVREQMKNTLEGLHKAWNKRTDKTLLENLETALKSGDFKTIKSVVQQGSCLYSLINQPSPSGGD